MIGYDREGGIERRAEARRKAAFRLPVFGQVGLKHHGTERRRQGKGVDGGDADGSRHGDTELRIERARRAAHQRNGDEHGHEYQRSGDDGRRDAAHCVDCRHVRRLISGVETRLDSLHHDNGVIDDDTDCQHEGEQSEQVYAKSCD